MKETDGPSDVDRDGHGSFPASDPPSSWWGQSTARPDARYRRSSESEKICDAAQELLRRCRDGTGPTVAASAYRQLELAKLLSAIGAAVDRDSISRDSDLVRHAVNLAQHVLNYPAAPTVKN